MGRIAAWRHGVLPWACGNSSWDDQASYGLSKSTPLRGWAWEFLRRASKYRKAFDDRDDDIAGEFGLASLVRYDHSFPEVEQASEPKWLALQAWEMFANPGPMKALEDGQVAVVFDLRRALPADVLRRQLNRLATSLVNYGNDRPSSIATANGSSGGRPYQLDTLLTCLRFADAVASDQGISSTDLAEALGITRNHSARLHDVQTQAHALFDSDYLRLVDQDLEPLRQIDSKLRAPDPSDPWHSMKAPAKKYDMKAPDINVLVEVKTGHKPRLKEDPDEEPAW